MNQKRLILKLLLSRKRVDITCSNYLSNVRNSLIITFITILLLNAYYLSVKGIDFLTLVLVALNLLFFGLLFIKIRRSTSATSVKGDTLILNNSKQKHCVTSIRSINKIQTTNILMFRITRFSFELDGRNRSTILITRKSPFSFSPEHLLRKAIELSKKQKANHKPGPVTA